MRSNEWLQQLRYDPVDALLSSKNEAITYLTRRDILEERVPNIDAIRSLDEPREILKKQLENRQWLSLEVCKILKWYFG